MSDELPIESPLDSIEARILALYPKTELARYLEDVQFQFDFVICGFYSLSKDKTVQICTNAAGLNTNHKGTGRCQVHEMPELEVRSVYSKQLRDYSSLQEIFEEFSNRKNSIKGLDEEITLARTILGQLLSTLKTNQGDAKRQDTFRLIMQVLDSIRKTAESIANIEEKQSKGLTMDSISAFLWQLQRILDEEIIDNAQKIRIFDRISTECSFIRPQA